MKALGDDCGPVVIIRMRERPVGGAAIGGTCADLGASDQGAVWKRPPEHQANALSRASYKRLWLLARLRRRFPGPIEVVPSGGHPVADRIPVTVGGRELATDDHAEQ